jgi:hypothetical protein
MLLIHPKPLQGPKPLRLPRRKLVTLFAGFRCAYQQQPSEPVFVVCADSQETIEEPDGSSYRVSLQKIKPKKCGNFDIAIGGSSPSGELLDACVNRIEENVMSFTGTTIPELKKFISNELLDFGRKDAKLFSRKERTANLLILARSVPASTVECWHTRASQLLPVERKVLIGWDEKLYKHILDRLYPETGPFLPPQQAVLLGLHLLKIAEDTSNYVKAPITVIVGHQSTIQELPADRVQKSRERIELFRAQTDRILLSLADHTIRRPEYEAKLDEVKATALQLRDEFVQDSAPKSVEDMMTVNDLLPNLPVGGLVIKFGLAGPLKLTEDPADVGRWRKKIEHTKILGGASPVVVTVGCKCGKNFDIEFPNHKTAYGSSVKCGSCGESKILREMGMGATDDIRLKDPTQLGAQTSGQGQ